MKKLYEVRVLLYAMAEDEDEAASLSGAPDGATVQAEIATAVEAEWLGAIPFGADADWRCGELITASRKYREATTTRARG